MLVPSGMDLPASAGSKPCSSVNVQCGTRDRAPINAPMKQLARVALLVGTGAVLGDTRQPDSWTSDLRAESKKPRCCTRSFRGELARAALWTGATVIRSRRMDHPRLLRR